MGLLRTSEAHGFRQKDLDSWYEQRRKWTHDFQHKKNYTIFTFLIIIKNNSLSVVLWY